MAKKKYNNNSTAMSFFDLFSDVMPVDVLDENVGTLDDKVKKIGLSNEDPFKKLDKIIDAVMEHKNEQEIIKSSKGKSVKEDLLISKENLPTEMKDRYAINIEVLKKIDKLFKLNSVKEADAKKLAKYSGWGGLSDKFKEDSKSNNELKKLLGSGYEKARESTLTSFYTPMYVIKFIYKVLNRFGFDKGKILDPSTGTGRFLAGMKEDMYYRSSITALEPDEVSYKITKLLYQESGVINKTFEDVELEDNSFDLVVSNIPFGSFKVYDAIDKSLNEFKASIHNYFFLKAIKKVRVGGFIAFVTSTSTLDSRSSMNIREEIDRQCDFLGAIRLPMNTFSDTKVSTDIIFLQKTGARNKMHKFTNVKEDDTGLRMNQYFFDNRDMIIGTPVMVTNQFGKQLAAAEGEVDSKILDKKVTSFVKDIYEAREDLSYMFNEKDIVELTEHEMEKIRKDEIVLYNDRVMKRCNRKLLPVSFKGTRIETIKKYIEIKEIYKELINIQLEENFDNDKFTKLQKDLNNKYDKFVENYGFINSKKNLMILREDIYFYNIATLEKFNYKTEKYEKADIMNRRFIKSNEFKVNSVRDAYISSFFNFGKLDIEYIKGLLGDEDVKSTINKLCEENLIYYRVDKDDYVSRSEFISGNVKHKLKFYTNLLKYKIDAKKEATNEFELQKLCYEIEHLEKNVKILEENQPEYVSDVFFTLASTWIPIEYKKKFIIDTLNLNEVLFDLIYTTRFGYECKYAMSVGYSYESDWGTPRKKALDIVTSTMNMKDITIFDELEDGKKVLNQPETQLARNMQEKWRMEFVNYIKNDTKIYSEILDLYNSLFNTDKEREYENILTNVNTNPNKIPRKHQLVGASRIILSDCNTLLAHSVGSGKTITMILAAQEISRIKKMTTGKSAKSLFIIPKPLCESGQFAREYLDLYPQANVLATTSEDFTVANRRKLMSKIVNYDWDAIIIPHSSLSKIPMKPSTERKMVEKDLNELRNIFNYYRAANTESRNRFSVKKIETAMKNLEKKLKELNDINTDNGLLYWEELGITNIFIDEAHNFKNLHFPTKLQAAGITATDAKKTQDLYNKLRYFREVNGNTGVVFATATPISNSMCELYTLMKYLMPQILEEKGLGSFDEWASTYGEITAEIEVDVTGTGFKTRQRFSRFYNLPELMTLFKNSADIVHIEDISDINLPKLKGGKPTVVELELTDKMEEYVDELIERMEAIQSSSVDPSTDNMLKIVHEGKSLVTSPRLVGIDEDSIKVEKMVDILYDHLTTEEDTTHMIFCDLGTPKTKKQIEEAKLYGKHIYNVYQEIKDKLIKKGIDPNEIAFIHDAKDKKQKELIDKFNNAQIRVLIGSTAKLGEGVNADKHLKTLHHLSVPWRPSDIEQRVGRMVRQNNLNKEVVEYRYIVKNSFDAFSWQTLETKAKYIEQIMNGDKTIRSIEDMDNGSMSYAEAKACACGDNRILELTKLKAEYKKLKFLEDGFNKQKLSIHRKIKENEEVIEMLKKRIPLLKLDAKTVSESVAKKNTIRLNGKRYTEIEELKKDFKNIVYDSNNEGFWGTVYGLDIYYDEFHKTIYIGQSRLLNVKFKKLPIKLLKELLSIKNKIKEVFKNNVNYYNGLLHENDELKFKMNKEFDQKERKDYVNARIKELENVLLIDNNSNAV